MLSAILARIRQKHRTMAYPDGPAPDLPPHFRGRPMLVTERCEHDCENCIQACPTGAIGHCPENRGIALDTGACLFCGACEKACPNAGIVFGRDYDLAAAARSALIVSQQSTGPNSARSELASRLLGRSLKLRQVSAGGCNACEADSNVLGTLAWDMGRFGIQFVASPRHADGLLVTGPVTRNMHLALRKTYDAVPHPKIVIAVGACAISGGPYRDGEEQYNGVASVLPVDLFIPGCPPHPLTILDGLLRFIGRIPDIPSGQVPETNEISRN